MCGREEGTVVVSPLLPPPQRRRRHEGRGKTRARYAAKLSLCCDRFENEVFLKKKENVSEGRYLPERGCLRSVKAQ